MLKWGLIIVLCGLLAACDASPSRDVLLGEIVLRDEFNDDLGWRTYDSPGLRLQVENGKYRGEMDGGVYVWGIKTEMYEDVVLEIEAEQVSAGTENGYGLVCRADPGNDGDGYYFLVSGDGAYSIRRGRDQEVKYLVAWQRSDAVYQGSALNEIRAVCIGDYLAMYVNGQFVAEAWDSLYTRGYAGVAFTSTQNTPVIVEFDNLTVWEARLSNPE